MSEPLSPAPGAMERQTHRGTTTRMRVRCGICRELKKVRRRSFEGAERLLEVQGWCHHAAFYWTCPACMVFVDSIPTGGTP